ncbi:MAG TPA: FHA domain-containing protein [Candidatus Acidoferrum sp.]|nr:FHA domain-containing protein [Candidatus Acidoferrum sp.]
MADANARPVRCAKGHAMDPNWETCSYCEAEQRSNQRTTGAQESFDRQRTVIGSPRPNPPEPQRVTRAMGGPGPAQPGAYAGAGDTRRLAGLLITYTWLPQGQVFKILEGKNFIGSGNISSEADHRPCDILVDDTTMSAEHALILCRQGNYEILDQISSNGTFLGTQMLKANQGTELPNYAEIKTGSTLWTFIMVKPPAGQAARPAPAAAQPPAPSPKEGDTVVR